MSERCGYCGRFMSLDPEVSIAEFGELWVCSQQAKHIESDPEHWSHWDDELGWVGYASPKSREAGGSES